MAILGNAGGKLVISTTLRRKAHESASMNEEHNCLRMNISWRETCMDQANHLEWGSVSETQPPHTRDKYKYHYGRTLSIFPSVFQQVWPYFVRFGFAALGMFLIKNLLMPLFLMGCFPVDFSEGKTAPQDEIGETPHKGRKTAH